MLEPPTCEVKPHDPDSFSSSNCEFEYFCIINKKKEVLKYQPVPAEPKRNRKRLSLAIFCQFFARNTSDVAVVAFFKDPVLHQKSHANEFLYCLTFCRDHKNSPSV